MQVVDEMLPRHRIKAPEVRIRNGYRWLQVLLQREGWEAKDRPFLPAGRPLAPLEEVENTPSHLRVAKHMSHAPGGH